MSFAEGLILDAQRSCKTCEQTVAGCRSSPELGPHIGRAEDFLSRVGADIASALGPETDAADELATVAGVGSELNLFRSTRLPFFAHYGTNERYLTLLAARLADQAGLPIATPIVGTFSDSGYWTDTALKTLCVPAGEEAQLLGLPDLVHELGHLLIEEAGEELLSRFLTDEMSPYTQSLATADRVFGGRLYRQYQMWQIEFVADVLGVVICGPSYGFQHLRLNAQSGALIKRDYKQSWYPAEPHETPGRQAHPADRARTVAIVEALRLSGCAEAARDVEDRWATLTAKAGDPPDMYEATYPDAQLKRLVEMAVSWCDAIGVRRFVKAKDDSIVALIERGWREHLADPIAFAAAEPGIVGELRDLAEAEPDEADADDGG